MNKRIVIADDHVLMAHALRTMIEGFGGYTVLYEVKHGQELQEKFRQTVNIPDVVILDIKMPVMDGFETARWITEQYPDVKILALSMQKQHDDVLKIVQHGARGFLLKDTEWKVFEQALHTLIETGYCYPAWVTQILLSQASGKKSAEVAVSDREFEFLRYAATELTYKEIADKMFCSPRLITNDLFQVGLFLFFGLPFF
jgi:DNA-binding NarL/FixJ family response regulator